MDHTVGDAELFRQPRPPPSLLLSLPPLTGDEAEHGVSSSNANTIETKFDEQRRAHVDVNMAAVPLTGNVTD